jgi:hypothetical protein
MTLNLNRVMHEDTGNGYVTLNKETFVELVERCKEAEERVARMSQSMIEPSGSPKGRMRHDDHATSVAGAKAVTMRATSQKAQLLAVYGRFSATDEEAASLCDLKHVTYWMRCSELRGLGLIEDTGEVRTGFAGTPRMVCRITERGRAVLDGLRVSQ